MTATERCFSISPEDFSRKDLWFAMGYGDNTPDDTVSSLSEELINELVPKAKPKYMYRLVSASRLSPSEAKLDTEIFRPGGIICSYLDGMTDACIFVATAGTEFDRAVKEKDRDVVSAFIADSIGTVLAEKAVSMLGKELAPEKSLSLPYSPGYCGWDIREQQKFFLLFPPEPCGIKLSESSLMIPEKSISGFTAMGETLIQQPYHCDICKNKNCYKRRKGSQSR